MSTPPRRTKTDLRREPTGRPMTVGPQPVETSSAEAAMLLGEAMPDFSPAPETEPARPADDRAAKPDL